MIARHAAGLTNDRVRVERLGRYNSERARGIQHTPEWEALMRTEQYWFETEYKTRTFGAGL
jgi:hypothetical protein